MAPTNFQGIVNLISTKIFTPLIALLVVLAMFYFLWGLTKYLTKTGEAKSREEAKAVMVFSIASMFVMFSLWGLINVLIATFDFGTATVPIPSRSP